MNSAALSERCASFEETLKRDWADQPPLERESVVAHLKSCANCRRTAISADPVWVFRLAMESSSLSQAGSDPAATIEQPIDIEEMQQRVRGAVRARALETTEPAIGAIAAAGSRRSDLWRWLAAAGVVVASGLAVLSGSHDEVADSAGWARAEVTRHVEALPVVDDAAWSPARTRDEAELPQVLAHLSDREADVVWVVNAALEL